VSAKALQKLQISELKDQLSAAALDARGGKYEVAREELSGFFTFLNTALVRKGDANVTPEELKSLQPVLSEHDELITLVARNDPASADRLLNLDLAFREALAHPLGTVTRLQNDDRCTNSTLGNSCDLQVS
jgi:hypothetical protein